MQLTPKPLANDVAWLPEVVLRNVFGRAYEMDPDEVDVERELERDRFLFAVTHVCRGWESTAKDMLGETIIAQELRDFQAVDWAVERGNLRLSGVRTLVLDETCVLRNV